MKIYNSISELVGKTPLVKLNNYNSAKNLNATIYGKVEYFNPAGQLKIELLKQ